MQTGSSGMTWPWLALLVVGPTGAPDLHRVGVARLPVLRMRPVPRGLN